MIKTFIKSTLGTAIATPFSPLICLLLAYTILSEKNGPGKYSNIIGVVCILIAILTTIVIGFVCSIFVVNPIVCATVYGVWCISIGGLLTYFDSEKK